MPLDGRVAGRAPVDAVHEQGGGVLSVPIGRRRSGARHAGRARTKEASPSTSGASAELAATGRRLPESKKPTTAAAHSAFRDFEDLRRPHRRADGVAARDRAGPSSTLPPWLAPREDYSGSGT